MVRKKADSKDVQARQLQKFLHLSITLPSEKERSPMDPIPLHGSG